MQGQDKIAKSSRPSLLTAAQQAEAERNRILSTLESNGAGDPHAARQPGRPIWQWGALAVAAIALAAGALHWSGQDGAPERFAAAPVQPAAPVARAEKTVAVTPPATATIEETHAEPASATPTPGTPRQSLSDMLGAAPPAAPPGKNVLSQALEAPGQRPAEKADAKKPGKVENTSKKDADKKADKHTDKKSDKKSDHRLAVKPNPGEKETSLRRAVPEPDGDVAILSALMAHAHASEAAAAVKPRRTLDQELAACRAMKGQKAARCHERVCEGRSKTGGCKVTR